MVFRGCLGLILIHNAKHKVYDAVTLFYDFTLGLVTVYAFVDAAICERILAWLAVFGLGLVGGTGIIHLLSLPL